MQKSTRICSEDISFLALGLHMIPQVPISDKSELKPSGKEMLSASSILLFARQFFLIPNLNPSPGKANSLPIGLLPCAQCKGEKPRTGVSFWSLTNSLT